MAAVMGRSIWNAMPLPSNGLRPRPLPQPGRNAACICGSGRKYKRCCAEMARSLPLDSRLLLPMVLKRAPKNALTDALRGGRAPLESIIDVALMHVENNKPRKAAETLEPLFGGPPRRGLGGLPARPTGRPGRARPRPVGSSASVRGQPH